jgi:hypothetical protein
MKRILCTLVLCTSFFCHAAEKQTNNPFPINGIIRTRHNSLGDTGAERVPSPQRTPSSPRIPSAPRFPSPDRVVRTYPSEGANGSEKLIETRTGKPLDSTKK